MVHQPKNLGDIPLLFGETVVEKRPELAALIGTIAAASCHVQRGLAHLYGVLLGSRSSEDPVMGLHDFDDVAFLIFEDAKNFRLQLDLERKLVRHVMPELLTKFEELVVPAANKANVLRNTIVHGMWAVSPVYPKSLIMVSNRYGDATRRQVYSKSDFLEALSSIETACSAIKAFEGKILDRVEKR